MFYIDAGTKLDRVKMTNQNPSVNFVGRANTNNGVTACVDVIDGLQPYKSGCLTLSLGGEYLGSCFVQNRDFYTSQNVNVLIPRKEMSYYCKQYIATMIFKEGRLHYKAFIDELNRHIKTDFQILLPVTSKGTPDWEYMENYMQQMELRAKQLLDKVA
ncbi:MAG: restriction endonuclease subunit S [Paludibacteraceae bacterium]